jgi:hypothetical protein
VIPDLKASLLQTIYYYHATRGACDREKAGLMDLKRITQCVHLKRLARSGDAMFGSQGILGQHLLSRSGPYHRGRP